MVISVKQLVKPVIAIFFIMILLITLSITIIDKSGHVQSDYITIEIFDINKECVVKKIQSNTDIQMQVKTYLNSITSIYPKVNPIPKQGIMVKVPLDTPIKIENQWLNTLVDEVIIVFPEQSSPYLLVFEDDNKPLFLTFSSSTEELRIMLALPFTTKGVVSAMSVRDYVLI